MITFLELYSNVNELKKVNLGQRKKMAIRMKKMAQSSAFKTKVAKSKLRVASPEKIEPIVHPTKTCVWVEEF